MGVQKKGETMKYFNLSERFEWLTKSKVMGLIALRQFVLSLSLPALVLMSLPALAFIPLQFQKPNNPHFHQQWALHNPSTGIDINIFPLWWEVPKTQTPIRIAVIDTGFVPTADLGDNIFINWTERRGLAQVDDDLNGYVDDIYGVNMLRPQQVPIDDSGHGSHVIGIIAAQGNNGLGIAGVAQNVEIIPIKYLDSKNYGLLKHAAEGIHYAIDQGARIINASWGTGSLWGGESSSPKELDEALARAERKGVLIVAGAGNDRLNNDTNPFYPASSPFNNIISVAAINRHGELWRDQDSRFGSNYGPNSVHIAAPGDEILSYNSQGDLVYDRGTSMAAPHVAGVAALILSREPELKATDIKERLMNTARPLASLRDRVVSGGMVSAYHAVHNILPEPDPNDPFNWRSVPWEARTLSPYPRNYRERFEFHVPGAQRLAVHFASFSMARSAPVNVLDGQGRQVAVMTGSYSNKFSPVVEGDTLILDMDFEFAVSLRGFVVDKVAVDR